MVGTLTTKARPSRARRIARRAGQVLLIGLFVGVLAGGWAYHRARAQVGETLMSLGEQMMRYVDARTQDAPRDLVLNGETVRFSSGTADRSATEVLDFFEARCAESDGGLAQQLRALHEAQPDLIDAPPDRGMALREDNGKRGYVACVDFGSALDLGELGSRLVRFTESGDIGALGEMRYVFVEQYEHRGEPRTHFVAMWTTGSFNLARMFPEEGDAPGLDIEGVARPPTSRRVLTGFERGHSYVMSVYETRKDEGELELFYRRALEEEGFRVLTVDQRADSARTLVAEQGQRLVTIVFSTNLSTGWANTAILDAR